LNGNYNEKTQENIKVIIVTGKRISRHRERTSILNSQQTFEDWIAEISSLKLELIQSNGKEIEYSAERAIRVFLSYSHIDNVLVGEIKKKLEVYGLEAFLAHEDIEPSKEWVEEIIRNLKECDVFIPFINENFKKSKWTDQESGIVFAKDAFVIPINIGLMPYGFIGKYQALPYENSSKTSKEIVEIMIKKNPLMMKRIQDDLINTFKGSEHYSESNYIVKLLEKIEPFTGAQVNELIRAFVDNIEVQGAWDAIEFIEGIVERYSGLVDPELLRKYKHAPFMPK